MSSLDKQEGGEHYRGYRIQPVEYIIANGIGFLAGNVIKYVTRYRDKGGAEDIRKAIHYLELILEFEYRGAVNLAGIQRQRMSSDVQANDQNAQRNPEQGLRPAGTALSGGRQEPRAQRSVQGLSERNPRGES